MKVVFRNYCMIKNKRAEKIGGARIFTSAFIARIVYHRFVANRRSVGTVVACFDKSEIVVKKARGTTNEARLAIRVTDRKKSEASSPLGKRSHSIAFRLNQHNNCVPSFITIIICITKER